MNLEQGKRLIKLARDSIQKGFDNIKVNVSGDVKNEFKEMQGCFVTLTFCGDLRGCIGFPEPTLPLWEGIIEAARSAAFSDPRFRPLSSEEFKHINVEVSVLTAPKLIEVKDAKEYLKKIKIGRDGLIIRSMFGAGLLLPQVPLEWGWDVLQFLDHTSQKAGLPPHAWKDLSNKIYSFQAQVFSEENGKVVEKM